MSNKKTEDAYGEKIDRCLYNGLSKFVVGVGIGIVTAAVVRFKPWPIILGAGIGTGMGISDCNYEFKSGSLTKVVHQQVAEMSQEGFAESTRQKFAGPLKKSAPVNVENEFEAEEKEYERKERIAAIVGHKRRRSEDFED